MRKIDLQKKVEGLFRGKPKTNVALALSTGGARGLAHIGAIEQLLDSGYHITSIAGTSMGALIGGMYAAGRLEDYRDWMRTIDRRRIRGLIDFKLGFNSIAKGERIINAMKEVVPDVNIEDLEIPYCAIATDITTGHEVIFNSGSLYEAIRASISLPVFFEPVKRGTHVYVDGGLTNPLPLNRVKRTPGDLLVGIDVSGHNYLGQWQMQREIDKINTERSPVRQLLSRLVPSIADGDLNAVALLNRAFSISICQHAALMRRYTKPDIYVGIPLTRYNTFDFDKVERLEAIGRAKTRKTIDDFQAR